MSTYSAAVSTAREYYNSKDADTFYTEIWGGEDIHVGTYLEPNEAILTASRRTVERMTQRLGSTLSSESDVLDQGSGYGGASRYLVKTFGCRVTALNLSEIENERHRELNAAEGLTDRIEVIDGSFESVPMDDASVDVVWSQDAILHSGDRAQVLSEAYRVLRPGGELIFTDPMQSDDCPPGVLKPILDRIHLSSLGSPSFYREAAEHVGFESVAFDEQTPCLVQHYSRVLEETERSSAQFAERVSADYVDRMKNGLQHWIDGGEAGYLTWGIFLFRKQPS
jgi:SAM-dependent methyltransferase